VSWLSTAYHKARKEVSYSELSQTALTLQTLIRALNTEEKWSIIFWVPLTLEPAVVIELDDMGSLDDNERGNGVNKK
jgi:hypothetical protein